MATLRHSAAFLLTAMSCAAVSLAQSNQNQPTPGSNTPPGSPLNRTRTLLTPPPPPAPAPAIQSPFPKVAGVPAKLPRPISGIGGVRAGGPRVGGPKGTLIPPVPPPQPRPDGSFPIRNPYFPIVDQGGGGGTILSPGVTGAGWQVAPFNRPDLQYPLVNDAATGYPYANVGSSFTATYTDDRWKLAIRLGNAGPCVLLPCNSSSYYKYGGILGSGCYLGGVYYDSPPTIFSTPTYTPDSFVNPPSTPPWVNAPVPLSELETAQLSLTEGRTRQAIGELREYLKTHPDDTDTMRTLALALIDDNAMDQAAALIGVAYDKHPSLSGTAVALGDLAGGTARSRRWFNRASVYANKADTASAWLTACVIAQGEGRDDVARKMLDRAIAKGLNESLAREFKLILGTP